VPLLACALLAPAAAPAPAAAGPAPTGGTPAPEPAALVATQHVLVGKVARFRGTLTADDAGRTVTIERLDAATQAWTPVATALVQADGSYVADWRADVAGRHRTRANVARSGAAVLSAAQPDEASMTVYRPAVASWFGPGFYGRRTACGQRMTRSLLGVAHKRLPCGAGVALSYGGRSITVPVVDRGPYVKGRRWDLTAATAKALGFTFTDRIGAVRIA
jgi:rare lipoprotein A (peptidoglycan hydrolase)